MNKANLLKHAERRYLEFKLPDVGTWRIQNLTEGERAAIEATVAYADDPKTEAQNLKARLIMACSVDEEGLKLFADSELEHVKRIDSSITGYIVDKIEQHCGITKADIEDLEKNYEETRTDSSPCA